MPKAKKHYAMPIIIVFSVYLFFFLLKSPILANKACYEAIKLCYSKVIPSLFPFLVLNQLMISSGFAQMLGKIVGKPISKLFGISEISSFSFISGCLFGFPLGTKSVSSLYENKYICKEEAEKLVCFCSNTGPSFVLGFVGIALNNYRIAAIIYFSQILSAVIIGLILKKKTEVSQTTLNVSPDFSLSRIPSSVTLSLIPMLNICCYVCFFSVIGASVENLLLYLPISNNFNIFFTGFIEITNGISKLEPLGVCSSSLLLCAFFVGWSGISVILQSIGIMSECGLPCKKFIISKFFQGIICAFLSFFLSKSLYLY